MKKQRPPIASYLTGSEHAPELVNSTTKCICCYPGSLNGFKAAYKTFALIFALFVSTLAYGQNKTVTGKIIDSATNQGISGASVKIKNTARGVIADPDGMFKIEVPANGILQISSVNYRPLETNAYFSDRH